MTPLDLKFGIGHNTDFKKNTSYIKLVITGVVKKFLNQIRYASRCAHSGYPQYRKDDLESLSYNILYFCLSFKLNF